MPKSFVVAVGRTIGEAVLSFSKGAKGVYFTGLYFYRCSVILIHCSCCARNETLAVSSRYSFLFLHSMFEIASLYCSAYAPSKI